MNQLKFYIILITMIMYSCENNEQVNNKKVTEYKEFISDEKDYNEKVFDFLKNENLYDEKLSYIIFSDGFGNINCSKGNYSEIIPYLLKTSNKVLIITNDSNLIDFENKIFDKHNINFKVIPEDVFNNFDVKHGSPHFYETKNSKFKGQKITSDFVESIMKKLS